MRRIGGCSSRVVFRILWKLRVMVWSGEFGSVGPSAACGVLYQLRIPLPSKDSYFQAFGLKDPII